MHKENEIFGTEFIFSISFCSRSGTFEGISLLIVFWMICSSCWWRQTSSSYLSLL